MFLFFMGVRFLPLVLSWGSSGPQDINGWPRWKRSVEMDDWGMNPLEKPNLFVRPFS
jgi:hypothetical protein